MTPPNPTGNELDEILNELAQYVHGVASASRHYGIFIGGEPMESAKSKLTKYIEGEIKKARIETLLEVKEKFIEIYGDPTIPPNTRG
jgi:hypothetical protein